MKGCCMNCCNYAISRNGDVICTKYNRPAAALAEKPCFEPKREDNPSEEPKPLTKTCKVCGRELPVTEFKTSPFCKDGRTNTCKECAEKHRLEGVKRYHDGLTERKAAAPDKESHAAKFSASVNAVRVCDNGEDVEIVLRAGIGQLSGLDTFSAIGKTFTVTFAEG